MRFDVCHWYPDLYIFSLSLKREIVFLAGPSAPGSWADSFYANNGFEDDEETIIKTFSFALHPVLQSNLTGLRNNLGQKRELQNYPKLLTWITL